MFYCLLFAIVCVPVIVGVCGPLVGGCGCVHQCVCEMCIMCMFTGPSWDWQDNQHPVHRQGTAWSGSQGCHSRAERIK